MNVASAANGSFIVDEGYSRAVLRPQCGSNTPLWKTFVCAMCNGSTRWLQDSFGSESFFFALRCLSFTISPPCDQRHDFDLCSCASCIAVKHGGTEQQSW